MRAQPPGARALFSHRGPQLISADLQTDLSAGTPTSPAAPPGTGAAGPALIPLQTAPECRRPLSSLSASPPARVNRPSGRARPRRPPAAHRTAGSAGWDTPNPRSRRLPAGRGRGGGGCAGGGEEGDGRERLTRAGSRRSGPRRRPPPAALRRAAPSALRGVARRGAERSGGERRAGRAPPRSALQDLSSDGSRRAPPAAPPRPAPAAPAETDRGPLPPPPSSPPPASRPRGSAPGGPGRRSPLRRGGSALSPHRRRPRLSQG